MDMRVAHASLEKDAIGDVETLLARGAAEKCASQEARGDGTSEQQKPQPEAAFESRRPGFQLNPPCQVMGLVPAGGLAPPVSAAPLGPAAGCSTCVALFSRERAASSMVAETAVAREGEEDEKIDPSPTVQAWSPWAGELGTNARKEQGAGDKRSATDAAMEDACARPGSLFDKQRAKLSGAQAVPGSGGKLAVHRDDDLAPQHLTSVDDKQAASNPKHRLCPHQRRRSSCRDCGGSSICPHKRRRSQCKDCGGASICQHNRERTKCKQCGGRSLCQHGRQKSQCKDCGGSGICEHNRKRSSCVECGGASLCPHRRQKSRCKECGGSSICEHQRQKSQCKECKGSGICPHQRRRSQCKDCGGGSICQHKRERTKCKECGGKSLCAHARQKSQCKECRGVRALLAAADELTASTASGGSAENSALQIMGAL